AAPSASLPPPTPHRATPGSPTCPAPHHPVAPCPRTRWSSCPASWRRPSPSPSSLPIHRQPSCRTGTRRHARQAVSCMPSADLCSARVSKREFNPSGEKRDGPCVRDKRNNSVLWADCGRSQLGSARSRGGQATGQSTHGFFCTIDLPLVLLLRGLAMVVPVIAGGGQLARTGGGEGVRGRWLGRSSAS
ncbi:hypothetical protein RTBOTA2_002454, partial [Rhodotorula toruloides]